MLKIKNHEHQFLMLLDIQPGRATLTPDDLVNLWEHGLEIDDNNQRVPKNAEPPDELEVVEDWVLP